MFKSPPASKDSGSLMVVLLLCVGDEHPLPGTSGGAVMPFLRRSCSCSR